MCQLTDKPPEAIIGLKVRPQNIVAGSEHYANATRAFLEKIRLVFIGKVGGFGRPELYGFCEHTTTINRKSEIAYDRNLDKR